MNSFKNHSKRNRYRQNGDRHFKKRNGELHKFKSDYSSNINFQRKSPGRNNHNASKLVEKYNDLAREALSKGDKILSENYFQHADHFIRIQTEKEKNRIVQSDANKTINKENNKIDDQTSKEKTAISN